MTSDAVNNFANIIVLLAAVPFWAFSVTYALRDPFWETYLGTIIWGMVTSNALVLTYVATRRWWGDYAGYEWVAVILYTAMTVFASLFYAIYLVERRRQDTIAFLLPPPDERKNRKEETS